MSLCLADLTRGESPPHDVVLIGPRGNGKTALLRWFESTCRESRRKVDVVRTTAADIPDRATMLARLAPPAGLAKLLPRRIGVSALASAEWTAGGTPPNLTAQAAKKPTSAADYAVEGHLAKGGVGDPVGAPVAFQAELLRRLGAARGAGTVKARGKTLPEEFRKLNNRTGAQALELIREASGRLPASWVRAGNAREIGVRSTLGPRTGRLGARRRRAAAPAERMTPRASAPSAMAASPAGAPSRSIMTAPNAKAASASVPVANSHAATPIQGASTPARAHQKR